MRGKRICEMALAVCLCLLFCLLSGCGEAPAEESPYVDRVTVEGTALESETAALGNGQAAVNQEIRTELPAQETPAKPDDEQSAGEAEKPAGSAAEQNGAAERPQSSGKEAVQPGDVTPPESVPQDGNGGKSNDPPGAAATQTGAGEKADAPSGAEKPRGGAAPEPEKPPETDAPQTGEPGEVEKPSGTETARPDESTGRGGGANAGAADVAVGQASGLLVKENDRAVIDYSNTADGYVMVKFTDVTDKRLKVQVKGPSATYTYNLDRGQWAVFPLSDGNGGYQVKVFENTAGNKYAVVLSLAVEVALRDEFAPFLLPNQYVNYSGESSIVTKAAELTAGVADPMEKVSVVYNFVVRSLSYDKAKAAAVASGYLPDLDTVLETKKGICFDYAALMAGMLRSQGVPCKLVVGYAGTVYHAWISVWTEDGWVDGVIYFDGVAWHRMDPTYASTGKQSASIMAYIADDANYTTKYVY